MKHYDSSMYGLSHKAEVAKYAEKHGNEKAAIHFNLTVGTVLNYKSNVKNNPPVEKPAPTSITAKLEKIQTLSKKTANTCVLNQFEMKFDEGPYRFGGLPATIGLDRIEKCFELEALKRFPGSECYAVERDREIYQKMKNHKNKPDDMHVYNDLVSDFVAKHPSLQLDAFFMDSLGGKSKEDFLIHERIAQTNFMKSSGMLAQTFFGERNMSMDSAKTKIENIYKKYGWQIATPCYTDYKTNAWIWTFIITK